MLLLPNLTSTQVLLKQDPGSDFVSASHMAVVQVPFAIPDPLPPGSLALRTLFLSVDPYMRARMNVTVESYLPPFVLGQPMSGGIIAQVVAGTRGDIGPGDVVSVVAGFESMMVIGARTHAQKIDDAASSAVPLSYYLGIAGMPGATAYHGLVDICKPKAGETVFVSGAAGAVGLVVGQIAKLLGCRVIGSAGSDDKVSLLKSPEFGFDAAFNYKTVPSVAEALAAAAPNGIDCYFDNVGGEHLDAALSLMNIKGRVAACGMISSYNGETAYTYNSLGRIFARQISIQGFLISEWLANREWMREFTKAVGTWIAEGKLSYREHVVEGIENTPDAFVGLFKGENTGKVIIKVNDYTPTPAL
ncbi:hypothetical protein BC831DRAFT_458329 [Entophlyctis helioformis]|nr:hypothetical protein BC831DRAFT_458329 [Entophlyctis helioformis]